MWRMCFTSRVIIFAHSQALLKDSFVVPSAREREEKWAQNENWFRFYAHIQERSSEIWATPMEW